MKCDDFLGRLATGGLWKKLQARLHAARCARCAATRQGLMRLQAQLAEPAPLTHEQRRRWEQAATPVLQPATSGRAARKRSWRDMLPRAAGPRLAMAVAAAVALLLAVGVLFLVNGSRDGDDSKVVKQPEPGLPKTAAQLAIYTPDELEELEAGYQRLSGDLDRIEKLAALLDARIEVSKLVLTYSKLDVGRPEAGISELSDPAAGMSLPGSGSSG